MGGKLADQLHARLSLQKNRNHEYYMVPMLVKRLRLQIRSFGVGKSDAERDGLGFVEDSEPVICRVAVSNFVK